MARERRLRRENTFSKTKRKKSPETNTENQQKNAQVIKKGKKG